MSAPIYHCPHCQRETGQFVTSRDGHLLEAHRCPDHGEVVPVSRSPSVWSSPDAPQSPAAPSGAHPNAHPVPGLQGRFGVAESDLPDCPVGTLPALSVPSIGDGGPSCVLGAISQPFRAIRS